MSKDSICPHTAIVELGTVRENLHLLVFLLGANNVTSRFVELCLY